MSTGTWERRIDDLDVTPGNYGERIVTDHDGGLLFVISSPSGQLLDSLMAYNAGVRAGARMGRAEVQSELRRIIGAASITEGEG